MFEKSGNDTSRREFQKTLDLDESRRSRFDHRLKLRKSQREAHLQKRRRAILTTRNNNSNNNSNSGASQGQSAQTLTANLADLDSYVSQVQSTDENMQFLGIQHIRVLLSVERDPPTWQIFKTGIVPRMIKLMRSAHTNSNIKFECAWIFTNMAAENVETSQLIELGIIPAFVALYRSSSATDLKTAEQAIWGLGNIAGENARIRNLILKTGVLRDLLNNIGSYHGSMQSNAIWTISNLCRHKPYPHWDEIKCCVPVLAKLLLYTIESQLMNNRNTTNNNNNSNTNNGDIDDTNSTNGILIDILWTFTYVSDDPHPELNNQVEYLLNHNLVNGLVKILELEYEKYLHLLNTQPQFDERQALHTLNFGYCQPSLRTIGNIVTGPDQHTQSVLDAGFLDLVQPYLNHFNACVRKEMLWTISNICAGSAQHIEYFLSRDWLLKRVVEICENDITVVRREAGWVLCNAANGSTPAQKERLVQFGIIKSLVSLLQLQDQEAILRIAMEGCSALLEVHMVDNAKYNAAATNNGNGNGNSSSVTVNHPWADMFEDCGGLDFLEDIQSNSKLSETCYELSVKMISRFFGVQEEMRQDFQNMHEFLTDQIQPNIDTKSNQFAFGSGVNLNTCSTNTEAGNGNGNSNGESMNDNNSTGNGNQYQTAGNGNGNSNNGQANNTNNNRFDF